jgi:N6-L-threonylcarbamoyladenine synthase
MLTEKQKADIAASFQQVACETIVDKVAAAEKEFQPKSIVMGGGVAANVELRRQLSEGLTSVIEYPDLKLCTDNGAMVATLGCYHYSRDYKRVDPYELETKPNLSM